MNLRLAIFPLLIATAFSGPAANAQDTPNSLRIDCQSLHRPTQREVAQALDIHNFPAAYAARERIMDIARQACRRGQSDVEIVSTPKKRRHGMPVLVANATPAQ